MELAELHVSNWDLSSTARDPAGAIKRLVNKSDDMAVSRSQGDAHCWNVPQRCTSYALGSGHPFIACPQHRFTLLQAPHNGLLNRNPVLNSRRQGPEGSRGLMSIA